MELLSLQWKNITRQYFSDSWVENEIVAMKAMIAQQEKLPVSVEQARA